MCSVSCLFPNIKITYLLESNKININISLGFFQVHDSVFDRPHCFQLVERALPCLATITYLAAPNSESAQDWINALKPLCVSQLSRAPKVARLRELRSLHLHILDAHRLPYKLVPNPFIIVALNNVKVARTKVKTCLHPLWDEEFLLEYVRNYFLNIDNNTRG